MYVPRVSCARKRLGPGRSPHRGWAGPLTLAATLLLLGCVCAACATVTGAVAAQPGSAATRTFFADHVAPDGRVIRTDQGGDTVSEGQAYGMLLAVGVRDRSRFAAIWNWTRVHLQRPDHLLAYRWSRGRVLDANAAPDADLDVAAALLRAASTFGDETYRRAGIAIANSVLTYESVTASPGALITAGTWAVADPATLNPSYLTPGEALFLGQQTGNRAWYSVAAATRMMDRELASASDLPPDWATVPAGAAATDVRATGSPDGTASPRYGLDAPRLIIRLAASCSAVDRRLAASYATKLGGTGEVGNRTLTGQPLVTWHNAVTDVALYAARTAAGDTAGARAALTSAQHQEADYPTYYGSAWIALAPLMLNGYSKESC